MLNSMSEISYNRIGTNNLKEKEKIGNERFRPRLHLRGPIKTGLSIPYAINFWPKYPVKSCGLYLLIMSLLSMFDAKYK